MINETLDEILDGCEAMLLEPREVFDPCVIGIAERINLMVAAYDVKKVLQALQDHHGMDEDEAYEWYEHNMVCSWVGNGSPVFINRLDGE